jgi:hypothetical protein
MRLAFPLLAGAILSSTLPVQAAEPRDRAARGAADLAREIEGRVAGEPVACMDLDRVRSSRIIDRNAILYKTGGTVYVNRLRSGAGRLDEDDIMVIRSSMSRICRGEAVELVDRGSHIAASFVLLGDFIPYAKAKPRD